MEGNKIFANHIHDKTLMSKTYKEFLQLNCKQNKTKTKNNTILKMGKGPG